MTFSAENSHNRKDTMTSSTLHERGSSNSSSSEYMTAASSLSNGPSETWSFVHFPAFEQAQERESTESIRSIHGADTWNTQIVWGQPRGAGVVCAIGPPSIIESMSEIQDAAQNNLGHQQKRR